MPNSLAFREASFPSMKRQSLILGVLLVLVPALSAAQADRFGAFDRNGDGFISSEEWYRQGVAPVPFTVVDLNGDGRISDSEFREWSAARGGANVRGMTPADRFRTVDKNKDGVISAEEWKDGSFSLTPFASVDANKDGTISPREFSAWDQRRGGPTVATPAPAPGSAAPTVSSGPAGAAGPPGVQLAPAASSPARSPLSPPPTAPSVSTGAAPGVSSPNMRSGSSLTTK